MSGTLCYLTVFLILSTDILRQASAMRDEDFMELFKTLQNGDKTRTSVPRELKPFSLFEIDSWIEEVRQCNNLPALSVSIAINNPDTALGNLPTEFAKTYGKRSLDSRFEADNGALFCIGSITKHMTATLLMKMLRMSKKQGLNYSEKTLLKELDPTLDFHGSNLRDVTIEDALSHQSGIAEVAGPILIGYPSSVNRSQLAQIVARSSRIQPNRQIWHYNNHAFSQAGYMSEILAEKLTGAPSSWESLMHQYLFDPLGISEEVGFSDTMNYSRAAHPVFDINGQAREADPTILQAISPAGPAGSVCMSAKGMLVWMQMLTNKGHFGDQQVVDSEDIEDTWKTRISNYGLGWLIGKYHGHRLMFHSGYLPPFSSFLVLFPDLNISMHFSSNHPEKLGALFSLQRYIFDRLMGYQPEVKVPCRNATSPAVPNELDDEVLDINYAEYVGFYEHPAHGRLEIKESHGQLLLMIGRFGNATIKCRTSTIKCDLSFNGVLWYLSDTDELKIPGGASLVVINFWKADGENVHTVSLPWYAINYLVEFHRIEHKINAGHVILSSLFLTAILAAILNFLFFTV